MKNKIAVITGIAGQDGAYLANFLLAKKYRVVGMALDVESTSLWRLGYFGILNRVQLVKGDVADGVLIKDILEKYQPDEFYNLAGQSSVSLSWERPAETFRANALAVVQMLEVIRDVWPTTRFFQASSAEIFGNARTVVNERYEKLRPLNPYGVAKLAAHLAVKVFRSEQSIFVVNGVLFPHISPLQAEFTVTKRIASVAARIGRGSPEQLTLSDLKIRRDWGFAGDFVEAMWLMLQQEKPQDFIICGGQSASLGQLAAEALRAAGVKNWCGRLGVDAALGRKGNIPNMRGSSALAAKLLGWRPRTKIKELVKKLVDYEAAALKP